MKQSAFLQWSPKNQQPNKAVRTNRHYSDLSQSSETNQHGRRGGRGSGGWRQQRGACRSLSLKHELTHSNMSRATQLKATYFVLVCLCCCARSRNCWSKSTAKISQAQGIPIARLRRLRAILGSTTTRQIKFLHPPTHSHIASMKPHALDLISTLPSRHCHARLFPSLIVIKIIKKCATASVVVMLFAFSRVTCDAQLTQ